MERLESRVTPATIAVTGTGDTVALDGAVTLREAIDSVNGGADVNADVAASGAYGTGDTINFAIPGPGVQTISVTGDGGLPDIVKTVTIDGFTQPGSGFGAPLIQLIDVNTTNGPSGLNLTGVSGCLIRGLDIINFDAGPTSAGVQIIGGSNNRVQGNFLGVDASGTVALRNRRGVIIEAGSTGNIIGTDGDGVNDDAEGNLISGSINEDGVEIIGVLTTGNRVAGNLIGTDLTGTLPVPNFNGVAFRGGASGNIIGTNGDGVSDALERNIISGNQGDGVLIEAGSDNRVSGNFIGTDVSGTAALRNTSAGVLIALGTGNIIGTNGDGTADALEGNVISGNDGQGVVLNDDNNRVSGNFIGTNAAGTAALGNTLDGVAIMVTATGNIVGTNGDGVSDGLEGNVISGNTGDGLSIQSDGNRVSGNRIGTDVNGTAAIPNRGHGVRLSLGASNNVIGSNGDGSGDADEGNIIAFNSMAGVAVTSANSTGNRISRNSIFANGALGIDLDADGVTPNDPGDADAGPNDLLNFPVLTAAQLAGPDLVLEGYARPGSAIELFVADPDPTGFGQGRTYLVTRTEGSADDLDPSTGSYGPTVDGLMQGSDTTNRFRFLIPLDQLPGVVAGSLLTATATSADNTSEFSGGVTAQATTTLTGTVFEDVNYGGGAGRSLAASAGVGRDGVTVELYDASGNFLEATTTAGGGAYSFAVAVNASYSVRVVNGTVTSSRTGSTPSLLSVQTFRTDASTGTPAAVTGEVGGAMPSAPDGPAKTTGGMLGDAAVEQSVTAVGVGTAPISGLDFGFNFDTVVNTNNAGQGSLRQFITNSNALGNSGLAQVGQTAGVEASLFMIPSATDPFGRPADANFTAGRAVITLTTSLPAVTDASTHIDGTTQTANIGDTNAGTLGAGGTVGVDNLTLPTVPRPEVELRDGAGLSLGLTIAAPDAAVRGLAVFGFESANVFLAANGDRAVIEQNVLGSGATAFADPGAAARSGDSNLRGINAADAVVRNNLIGFAAGHGVWPQFGSGWQIEGNEVRSNALVFENYDGIEVNASTDNVVQGNLVVDSGGAGVNLVTATNTTVADNTVTGNGRGNEETAGIAIQRIDGRSNTVLGNVVAANLGPGVLVTDSSVDNVISRNSTFGNRGLGIDLALSGTTGDGVTLNDPNDADSGSNDLLNFPVLVSATVNGSSLELTGFARPDSVIELFVAAPDPTGFGEGRTYLVTRVEGSAEDLDPATGSYGPGPVNGLDVGSDTTNRFRFLIPLASLPGVTVGTALTATATLGGDTSEFSGNVTVAAPPEADLALTKVVDVPRPNVGDTITFTVGLTNLGPDPATGVQVTDLLPAGLTFESANPSQGTYDDLTGLWTVGTLASGAVASLSIQARVDSPDARFNAASVSHADQVDPNPGNDRAGALEVPQRADLQVSKTVSNPSSSVGDTITYTITLTDNGPDQATNVTVQDLLPAGLTLVSQIPSQGTYDSTTGVWTVGTVTTATAATLQIQAMVVNPNPQANTASISHADQFDPNTANNTDTASVDPQEADLALSKTVSNPTPNVGDTITFTVTLTDNGPNDATGVTVQDLLPLGLTLVSQNPSQGTYDPATGVWAVGTVTAATSQTLILQVTVAVPAAQTNTASIGAADQSDPVPGNNSAAATVTPQQADLAITKTVSNARPNVGDTITFTVTLADLGLDAATGVTVLDLLPAGLTLMSFNPSRGTYTPATGVWDVGTIDPSAAQTLTLTARVDGLNSATNTAAVSHADQSDPDPTNNSASATETPQQADLAISKTVSDATPNVGDIITYIVTVTDLGPDPATNVTVLDLLPPGLTLVSQIPSQGTYDLATGAWAVGTVTTTTPQTLTIQATVAVPAAQTNTASISAADQSDPVPGNNSSSATETPQQADLRVSKTVSDPRPNVGDTVTFTVTLTNLGPDLATGVQVTDLLPAGLTFASATPSQGSYDATTGIWLVGGVAAGPGPTLQIHARVTGPGAATNSASVTGSDVFDPVAGNNAASAGVTPQQADLALSKVVDNPTPSVGGTITFTVTLADHGPDTATNVVVTDLLPAGLVFVSATPSQGSYDGATGVWSVGTVNPTTPQTLTIMARVAATAAQTNVATIGGVDQFDPDPADNTARVTVTAGVTVTPQPFDLVLTGTVSNAAPRVGDTITYTLRVTNAGPGPAPGVTVVNTLPAGVSFVSASVPPASQAGGRLVFDLGTLAAGSSATINIVAVAQASGTLVNQAVVSSAVAEPDSSNNLASVPIEVPPQPVAPTTVSALRRFGFHAQPTNLVLTFSAALDGASARDVSNYALVVILPGGQRRLPLRLVGAAYDPAANTVTLRTRRPLPLRFHYQLTVDGTPPGGVLDATGRPIDGDGDGSAGGNFVRVFGRKILAGPSRPASPARVEASGPAAVGRGHRGPVSPALSGPGGDLNPPAVDAVLGAIAVRRRRR